MKIPKKGEKTLLLRLPVKVARALAQRAEASKRSVNSQIIVELDSNSKGCPE